MDSESFSFGSPAGGEESQQWGVCERSAATIIFTFTSPDAEASSRFISSARKGLRQENIHLNIEQDIKIKVQMQAYFKLFRRV